MNDHTEKKSVEDKLRTLLKTFYTLTANSDEGNFEK